MKFVESTLRKNNHYCRQMSSAMNQTQREKTLNEFRCGQLPILVATDVAGRGLDVRGLEYVVNYDFPSRLEVYVHRAGRTGRQGAQGHAYSFFGRHLGALAPGLVELLEASKQWVDPNLRALLPRDNGSDMRGNATGKSKGKGKGKGKNEGPRANEKAPKDAGGGDGGISHDSEDEAVDSDHSSDGLEQWSDSDDDGD